MVDAGPEPTYEEKNESTHLGVAFLVMWLSVFCVSSSRCHGLICGL